jgi:HTH-type transcriptional regulator/antitoxin HipB
MEGIVRDGRQLGQALRRQRELRGLREGELAAKAGLRQATLSELENGVGNARFDTIAGLLAALELELVVRPRTRLDDIEPMP